MVEQNIKPQAATGRTITPSTYVYDTVAKVNTETVPKYIQNIHYADNKQNLMMQVFPGPPEITVKDDAGEIDEELTARTIAAFERIGGYAAMQITVSDILDYGASVKSPGIERRNGEYELTEVRNLPAKSFSMSNGGYIVNPLMPGISIDMAGNIVVYQYDPATGISETITNYVIVKRPEAPEPAGIAYCLPVYAILAEIDFANKAAIQQVNRIGAPIFLPKAIDSISSEDYAELVNWHKQMARTWGPQTSHLLPPGIEFPDLRIHEGTTARDFIDTRVRWISAFFNPTTDLDVSGTALGATDSGRMEIWANYIISWQRLAETWLERLFNICHEYNGRDGYHTHIELRRPGIEMSALRLQYIQGLVAAKAITTEEIRDNARDVLALRTTDADVLLQLREQYPAASVMGLFGNTTEDVPNFTRPEDRIMAETEQKMIRANEASLEAIRRIMHYAGDAD